MFSYTACVTESTSINCPAKKAAFRSGWNRISISLQFYFQNQLRLCDISQRIKYGVVRMHDLAMDVLSWNRFYLSGRLQKPVCLYLRSAFSVQCFFFGP
jgi:Phosphatidate cytidylyltransferase, mitochondrial